MNENEKIIEEKLDNIYSVYIHTFPNGKHYVGITQQVPEKRWKYGAGYKKSQPCIYNAIKKYGWENIYHTILYTGLTKDNAEKKEIELIAALKSNQREFGYNMTNGGQCRGTLGIEGRRKISEARKGVKFNEEHKKNLSESHKGYKPSETQKHLDMLHNPKRKSVICIETGKIYNSIREAGKITGINHRRIGEVCNHKYGRKSAGGFSWSFVD